MSGNNTDSYMTDTYRPRCPDCGRFCNVVYRSRGSAGQVEVSSCVYCGINPPKCGHEDGTVTGCPRNATHEVPEQKYGRWWCEEHAPDGAEVLPYAEDNLRVATDGGTDHPPEFVTDKFPDAAWEPKARENVDRWGQQPPAELLLAIAEEMGELAEEITPPERPDMDDKARFGSWIRLRKLVNRGEDIQEFLEDHFEDDAGEPLPRGERPELIGVRSDLNPEAVQDELDDLGALLFQLLWALNGRDVGAATEQGGGGD